VEIADARQPVDELKGDLRMARLLARALRTRPATLKEDVETPIVERCRVESALHPRRWSVPAVGPEPQSTPSAVGRELANRLRTSTTNASFARRRRNQRVGELADLIRAIRSSMALERYGRGSRVKNFARPLRRAGVVARGRTGLRERRGVGAVHRARSSSIDEVRWTKADAP